MENQTGNLGTPLSLSDPASSAQKALLSNTTTYLAKIAIVLHDAPDKMLTFTQLMDKLTLFFSEDRKSIENNVRVCLSTNKCFVKVPIVPYSLNSKRNYWKLDLTQITAKMIRRHFRGILQLFPDLACEMQKENLSSRELEARRSVRIQREVKFRGPFSIDSLLKTDEHSAQNPGASPLSGAPLRVEQPPYYTPSKQDGTKRSFGWESEEPLTLKTAAVTSPIYLADGSSYFECGAVHPIKMTPAYPEATVFPRPTASYYATPHGSYATSLPAFTHDARGFWL
ncbi:forkhead box protein C2 [Oreochromis niloticus]|uniref:forkhead box protein C2 n=1 Tax=Oreochromis niloticus TaxID=8128 RepID=UPI0003943827|nr:forkhead box protein C2 [Oreochromis niloticus]XP_019205930.1 forkhead box protein C2 [Oreochromis niloticus]XP_019205931.1 forkhead box protein C2 [Oreochromis niloticus]CAI5690504.1 unnamed protein product [Mustela putorius furo]